MLKKYFFTTAGLIGLLFLSGCSADLSFLNKNKILPQETALTVVDNNVVNSSTETVAPSTTPAVTSSSILVDNVGNYVEVKSDFGIGRGDSENFVYRDYTKFFLDYPIKVDWHLGARPLSDEEIKILWSKVDPSGIAYPKFCEDIRREMVEESGFPAGEAAKVVCFSRIYEAGVITAPTSVKNKKIYFVFFPSFDIMSNSFGMFMGFFDDASNKFVIFGGPRDTDFVPSIQYGFYSGIADISFPELPVGAEIKGVLPDNSGKLALISSNPNLPFVDKDSPANNYRGGILEVLNKKVADYSEFKEIFTIDNTKIYSYQGCFYTLNPDGSFIGYDLMPYFLGDYVNPITDIIWNQNLQILPSSTYRLAGDIVLGSCNTHISDCTNIVNDKTWFKEKNLVTIGQTQRGEKIYELADKSTNKYYQDFYNFSGGSNGLPWLEINDPSSTYSQLSSEDKWQKFLSSVPIFFWKDPRGNWRDYYNTNFSAVAECGKPVIYLYPEKETNINVKVAPTGGLTVTDPIYGNEGWNVKAKPNGEIFNYSDEQKYPYLFWEGRALNFSAPAQGFVISRAQVGKKMTKILARLGLNSKETADFLEFWQPKLEKGEYVLVSFVPQTDFDQMAPLTVSPRPDTVIRIFMDYTLLDQPISVAEPIIKTPVRAGFTVVEWGGRLHK